jgi:hypothetical protein
MTEELPPIWALNKAAKAVSAGLCDWSGAQTVCYPGATDLRSSIIAHARTIAQYEQPPVDEDEASLERILKAWCPGYNGNFALRHDQDWPAALAQFKRELEGRK